MTRVRVTDGGVRLTSGRVLTPTDLEHLADEAEHDVIDVAAVAARATRGPGRPALGDGPSTVLQVRLDRETRRALDDRAAHEGSTPSAIAREAIRRFLDAS